MTTMTAESTAEDSAEPIFIAARWTEREANAVMHALAPMLKRCGVAERFGLYVEESTDPLVRWQVLLWDRTPTEGVPDAWERAVMSLALSR
ncbi:hypothetical protein ACFYXL_05820 [Streptomyces tsukubensis]|uniref:hypothetical protein n=1 Tax=Streptomyces tsukubensis TaxID=83656 RepID=UPI0036B5F791